METKEKNAKKIFDAVKFMREQRNRITKETFNLSPEEIVRYFEQKQTKESVKPGT